MLANIQNELVHRDARCEVVGFAVNPNLGASGCQSWQPLGIANWNQREVGCGGRSVKVAIADSLTRRNAFDLHDLGGCCHRRNQPVVARAVVGERAKPVECDTDADHVVALIHAIAGEMLEWTGRADWAEREGACVFNSPAALRDHPEKLAILEFPQFTAPTLVTRSEADIRDFHAAHGEIILKPLDGMGGMGIFKVGRDGLNLGAITETLNRGGAQTVMVQKYLPQISEGDKRVLLIGGQAVPHALARIPQGSEVRGNLAAGGKGVAMPITEREREIAETLGPVLAARGLLLVGLDVIGGHLTEINVTSPTCFQEISDQTGFDVPAMFISALEKASAS